MGPPKKKRRKAASWQRVLGYNQTKKIKLSVRVLLNLMWPTLKFKTVWVMGSSFLIKNLSRDFNRMHCLDTSIIHHDIIGRDHQITVLEGPELPVFHPPFTVESGVKRSGQSVTLIVQLIELNLDLRAWFDGLMSGLLNVWKLCLTTIA